MTNSKTDSGLLNDEQAGDYLGGVPPGTLSQWRYLGKGPAFVKFGRHIRYRRADLDAFIRKQTIDPQAQAS